MTTLKQRLRNGEHLYGTMVTLVDSPDIVRIAKVMGFDYLIIDNEHGCFDYGKVAGLLGMGRAIGMPCLVRLPDSRREAVLKYCEMGADGFLLPNCDTAEQAAALVSHAKYAPQGNRGGTIGMRRVITAKPDGYTLLFYHTEAMLPKIAGMVDYDLFDLQMCGIGILDDTTVLATYEGAPYKTLNELVDYAAVMLIIITISLVTQCDSMVVTLSGMSLKEGRDNEEPPVAMKLFWGVMFATIALIFTLLGGIDGVKIIKSICGMPLAFLCFFITLGFIFYMVKRPRTATGEYEYEHAVADAPDNGEEPASLSPMGVKIATKVKAMLPEYVESDE